jgi:tetratricopeptide (TPR) repeat protein
MVPLVLACAVGWTLLPRASRPVHAQDSDNWTGKRVVQKSRNFVLRFNDEPVERTGKWLDFYKVQETDGPSLLLKAEGQGARGWAADVEVVPVEKAIDYFTAQIRARPRDAFGYAMRGFLRHDKHEIDSALDDYNQAIRLDPRDPLFCCARGCAWQTRNAHDKAIADFDAAIRLDPKNTLPYIGRGKSRASIRDYTNAIADFNEAIWLDPLSVAAYVNRGRAWHCKKEYEKAIVDYNLAIRLDPQDAFALCERGKAWAARKQYGRAVADFNEAIQLDAHLAPAHRALACVLATNADPKVRNIQKAIESATKACELTQWKDAGALDSLAVACAAAGDFASAVNWQTKAIALDPGGEHAGHREARLRLYRRKQPYLPADP